MKGREAESGNPHSNFFDKVHKILCNIKNSNIMFTKHFIR